MKTIKVLGLASQKIVKELIVQTSDNESLMDFLTSFKIPIASSCGGAGTCKKCVVNTNLLSCQISLKDFIQDKETSVVEVSYL
jgi:Na+-transporting NADH:ubiquinone oxidoreductase subunit NqrF